MDHEARRRAAIRVAGRNVAARFRWRHREKHGETLKPKRDGGRGARHFSPPPVTCRRRVSGSPTTCGYAVASSCNLRRPDKIRQGIDAVEERKAARAALAASQRRGLTFAEAVDRYLAAKLEAVGTQASRAVAPHARQPCPACAWSDAGAGHHHGGRPAGAGADVGEHDGTCITAAGTDRGRADLGNRGRASHWRQSGALGWQPEGTAAPPRPMWGGAAIIRPCRSKTRHAGSRRCASARACAAGRWSLRR